MLPQVKQCMEKIYLFLLHSENTPRYLILASHLNCFPSHVICILFGLAHLAGLKVLSQ